MPVQRFAPMIKDFPTFDCDAHVTERPLIWERAKDFLSHDELDALKRTIWWDANSRLLIVNGRAGVGLGSPRKGGIPPAQCESSPMPDQGSSTTSKEPSTCAISIRRRH